MNPELALLVLAIAALAGLSLGLARFRFAILCGLALCAAPVVWAAVNIVVDTSHDPTSHNLWPFEIVIWALAGLPPAVGLLLGWLARKLLRVPVWAGWIPPGMAVLLAVLSPAYLRWSDSKSESDITATLKRIWTVEMDYSRAEPQRRFVCDGPLLTGFERERWFPLPDGSNLSRRLRHGRYLITLGCSPGHFQAVADPRGISSGGNLYCIDETGIVQHTPADPKAVCGRSQ